MIAGAGRRSSAARTDFRLAGCVGAAGCLTTAAPNRTPRAATTIQHRLNSVPAADHARASPEHPPGFSGIVRGTSPICLTRRRSYRRRCHQPSSRRVAHERGSLRARGNDRSVGHGRCSIGDGRCGECDGAANKRTAAGRGCAGVRPVHAGQRHRGLRRPGDQRGWPHLATAPRRDRVRGVGGGRSGVRAHSRRGRLAEGPVWIVGDGRRRAEPTSCRCRFGVGQGGAWRRLSVCRWQRVRLLGAPRRPDQGRVLSRRRRRLLRRDDLRVHRPFRRRRRANYDWSIYGEDPATEGGIFDFARADNPVRRLQLHLRAVLHR